jgi:hypothetical protein
MSENPLVAQMVKNFPLFYVTRRRITEFTGRYPEPTESLLAHEYLKTYH